MIDLTRQIQTITITAIQPLPEVHRLMGWIGSGAEFDHAEFNSLVYYEWKPAGRAGDGRGCGAACLLPWVLGMPLPREGRSLSPPRGLEVIRPCRWSAPNRLFA